ncbi:PREDICTED: isopentenyl-diphosphate Delta-isomerase 1 [Eufriesea mexicana]|uniref:isopentenyl-diphosphate Delta-isomerase 1 n=1 Tax=Eufriesea mexicana TaxID=516756 RepID=UPI00083C8DA8|nr:PREDICTED: isopentenyl-diphosphate Delta-isomerase 1 [Eufriesea mexicana]XP_017761236.1 PREDICTED: isopentenyl-diphosphate Delta-isomerase 1 [Eufriesea mexicana]
MAKVIRKVCAAARSLTSTMRNFGSAQPAPLQQAALEERCILVDAFDKPLGEATKRDCHTVNSDGKVLLHRAFSVFLFNNKGELLLQKRSANKITFPNHYTNTCCSHPLAEIPEETEEHKAIGICRAARRRLSYELGIPLSQILLSDFLYLTRIHYQAVDGLWGEHEIDYVLFIQKDNVTLDPNPDEVSELRWVSQPEMNDFVKNLNSPLSPWFKLILKHKLSLWWNNLHTLEKIQDHDAIQRFT